MVWPPVCSPILPLACPRKPRPWTNKFTDGLLDIDITINSVLQLKLDVSREMTLSKSNSLIILITLHSIKCTFEFEISSLLQYCIYYKAAHKDCPMKLRAPLYQLQIVRSHRKNFSRGSTADAAQSSNIK